MSEENNKSLGFLSLAAVIIAVVALAVGAVLPQSGDLFLSQLGDVTISDPVDGQVLKYDAASERWVNLNESEVILNAYSFGNLTDSGIASPVVNQTLIYNGTNWVNQNQSTPFSVDGYDDLNFPALSLTKSASLTPTLGGILASGSIQGLLFNGATQVNEVYSSGEILHSYKQGSNLYPHVHWMSSTTGAGNVTWFLEYSIANVNGAYGAPNTINVTQATTGAAWVHRLAELPAIDGSGLTIGSQIVFRLYRDANAANDTYTDNAALISFGIHYQMDSVGSSSVSSK